MSLTHAPDCARYDLFWTNAAAHWDTNHDGRMSFQEYYTGMKAAGIYYSDDYKGIYAMVSVRNKLYSLWKK